MAAALGSGAIGIGLGQVVDKVKQTFLTEDVKAERTEVTIPSDQTR